MSRVVIMPMSLEPILPFSESRYGCQLITPACVHGPQLMEQNSFRHVFYSSPQRNLLLRWNESYNVK